MCSTRTQWLKAHLNATRPRGFVWVDIGHDFDNLSCSSSEGYTSVRELVESEASDVGQGQRLDGR